MGVFSELRLPPHARGALCASVVFILAVSGCGSSTTTRSAGAAEGVDCLTPNAVCLDQDFSGQDLSGKNLSGAILAGSRFDGADLRGTNFTGANLSGTSFAPAKCSVPFADMCLFDYQWNTLAPPVPVAVSSALKDFTAPSAMAVTKDSKTVYVADSGESERKVYRLDLSTGKKTAVAGSGTACSSNPAGCGDGLEATKIKLSSPSGLALDESSDALYIADAKANLIWQVDLPAGTASVVAGNGRFGKPSEAEGNDALDTPLAGPSGLAWDSDGNRLVFADTANNAVRALDIDASTIEVIAGQSDGTLCKWLADSGCGTTGEATDAILNRPTDVALAADGSVYIADSGDAAIRKVDTSGNISSILAPKSGTDSSKASTFPKPTFVEFDRDQNLLVGPNNADGTGIGWIAKAVATDGKRHDWTEVATVLGGVSPAASAVAPNLRYLLAADPKGGILSVGVPQLGPNVKDAKFTSAEMSSDSGGGTATTLDGIFQAGADFTGVKLVGARIQNSMLDNFNNVDMRRATIGALPQLTANSICLSGATLTAKSYPAWDVTNASMLAMRVDAGADKKVRKSVFDNATLTNVNFALADADSKLEFSDGDLTGVNFSPARTGKDNGQVIFNGTDLEPGMNSTGPDQDRPDYAAVPKKKWDLVKAAAACGGQEATADTVESTTVVAAAPPYRWCEAVQNPDCGVWLNNYVELNLDANSHLASGRIVQSTTGTGPLEAAKSFQYEIRLDRNAALIATGTTTEVEDPTNANALVMSLDEQIKDRDQALGVVRDGDTFSGEIRDGGRIMSAFQGTFSNKKNSIPFQFTGEAKTDFGPVVRTTGAETTVEMHSDLKLVGQGTEDSFNLTAGTLALAVTSAKCQPDSPLNSAIGCPYTDNFAYVVKNNDDGSVIATGSELMLFGGELDLTDQVKAYHQPINIGTKFKVTLSYQPASKSLDSYGKSASADSGAWSEEALSGTEPVVPDALQAIAGLDTGWNGSRLDSRLVVDKTGRPLYLSAAPTSTTDPSGFFKQTNLSLRVTHKSSNTSFLQSLRNDAGAPNDFWDGRALRYNLARGKSLAPADEFIFELVTPAGAVQSGKTVALDQPFAIAPAPATGVVAKADAQRNYAVSWTNGQIGEFPVGGYTILKSDPGGPYTPVPPGGSCADLIHGGSNTSCAATTTAGDAKWAFRVVTFDGSGVSATSEKSDPIAVQGVPKPPTAVSSSANTDGYGGFEVSWKGASRNSPILGYTITRSVNGGPYQADIALGTCAADLSKNSLITSCTVTDQLPQQVYAFKVSALNAIGPGPASVPSNPLTGSSYSVRQLMSGGVQAKAIGSGIFQVTGTYAQGGVNATTVMSQVVGSPVLTPVESGSCKDDAFPQPYTRPVLWLTLDCSVFGGIAGQKYVFTVVAFDSHGSTVAAPTVEVVALK